VSRDPHDGRSSRVCAGAGMGRGDAGHDADHRRAHDRLDRPLSAAGAAPHRRGAGSCPARRPGREWPGAADPRAALVARPTVGAHDREPPLLRAALLRLPAGQPVVVALDTTRLGPWEVWLAGVGVQGRTVPVGWAVIPYPWPKGRFRATTVALLQRLQGAFPPSVSWSMVAARGVPRAACCAQLRQAGTAFSVRWRFNVWVTVAGVSARVAEHLQAGRLVVGQRPAATMGGGQPAQPRVSGGLVVRAASVGPPTHQPHPGTARARAKRAPAQGKHRARQSGRPPTPPSATARRYAQTWVVWTTAPTVAHAGAA
jgi:hypothetical protein